ncbi:MAG: YfhO family protein, partial [Chloroflexia bacterium]|nr:YfhO family protein [Chloroflexia bacterium]
QELVEATTGSALDPAWERQWSNDPVIERAVAAMLDREDAGGAGAFLRQQQAAHGPFRIAGYSGIGYEPAPVASYPERRWEPGVLAILVNGRTMRLGLYDMQGYNPLQLRLYTDYLAALNSRPQNYHHANLLPGGFHSPLLDLLNVRYLLVDARIPADRADVAALRDGRQEVFRNDEVVIYENWEALPHAWVVHDVRSATPPAALALLASGQANPRWTAFVEGRPPPLAPATGTPVETAFITSYEADSLRVEVNATGAGLLVLSEVWAEGWQAAVNGVPAPILRTDGALRGVPIQAGHHTVELWYAPRSLQLGLLISGVATVAMLASFAAAAVSWTNGRGARAEGRE